jgi:4-hydroxymandelate oxidase
LWFQLYSFSDFEVNRALVRNAEESGCTVLAVTVDSAGGSPRIMQTRGGVKTEQRCKACHDASEQGYYREHGNFDGIDMTRALVGGPGRAVTWPVLEKLRAATKMKIVVKGVMTAEDAAAAFRAGVDGLIVSNHGGRAENSMQGTLDALPEIVEVVNGRIPVIVDGGIRRGVDIFKALALGANAVGIGRPYIWGLGAYGQAGVEKVIDLLLAELRGIMGSAGTTAVRHISPLSIERRV